ncbi:hypothetical protein LF63_0114705 [Oleiagrimonas soli]|uniref:Uncharacterized protein n=1 Tax=Oleiagrimonas soli TaxID=1543381 RepID=A0A099CSW6_9GAMM|nr:hypothetical protein LF63_0114705 [Oleiagrimonas soli]
MYLDFDTQALSRPAYEDALRFIRQRLPESLAPTMVKLASRVSQAVRLGWFVEDLRQSARHAR